MTERTDVGLHALEVLSAAIFGVLMATQPIIAIIPGLILVLSLFLQYRRAAGRWQAAVRQRLSSLISLIPLQGQVRATVHVPIKKGTKYKQAVDYVPVGTGSGRKFSSTEGIVGKCMAQNLELVENFVDQSQYDAEMENRYGYDVETKSRRTRSRRSYLAHPIMDDRQRVMAVLYLDSNVYNAFPPDATVAGTEVLERLADDISQLPK